MNSKFKDFMKRQVARLLAILMLFSTVVSSGLALTPVRAEPEEPVIVYGDTLVAQLVDIAADGVGYTWGGWTREMGVDCTHYVILALNEIFGNQVLHLASDPSVSFNLGYTYSYRTFFKDYVGQRFYIEGRGVDGVLRRMYLKVDIAGTQGQLRAQGYGIADMKIGDYAYSSYLSKVAQTPGTIIAYNGHCVTGIGVFNSAAEVLAKYPALNRNAAGSIGGPIVRFFDSFYNKGNSYSPTDDRYWFGKTCYIAAQNTASGIRTSNASATGKTPDASDSSECVVLIPESPVLQTTIKIQKIDAASGKPVPGAKYGIYYDQACQNPVMVDNAQLVFTTSTQYVEITLNKGTYYVKEIKAPTGYQLSTVVTKIDATGDTATVVLKDDATEAEILVRKVDAHETSKILENVTLDLYEYNKSSGSYDTKLCTLKYSSNKQGYTIQGSYTNNEGTTYNDNALHTTQNNQGRFKVVESATQAGYFLPADHPYIEFNILVDNTVFTGSRAMKNTAILAFELMKVDGDGNPLSGAEFKFEYNGKTYNGVSDTSGKVVWATDGGSGDILYMSEGASLTGVLTETKAPEGYTADPAYAAGKTVVLKKDTLNGDAFLTSVTVKNTVTPPPTPNNGKIRIQKVDVLYFGHFVSNAHYGIFIDEACTVPAKDLDGNELGDVVTDENGSYTSPLVEPGVYFIKEVQAPENYGIQMKVFTVDITGEKPEGSVYIPQGIGDKRQIVSLTLDKENADGEKLEGAIFALYLDTEAKAVQFPVGGTPSAELATINPGLVGYYRTDVNGQITVDSFTATSVTSDSGTAFNSDCKTDANGISLNNQPLPNGTYHFVEVAAPNGYILNNETQYVFDASWRENTTSEDIVINDDTNNTIVTVGPAGNTLSVKSSVSAVNEEQGVIIKVQKNDYDKNTNNVNAWYGLSNYDAQAGSQVATIVDAEYALLTNETMVINGVEVPSGTTVATAKTNATGLITFNEYNAFGLSGKIKNGQYKVVEVSPSYGYSLNLDGVVIDASWQNDNETLTVEATTTEEILKQAVTIEKIDGDASIPIEGVVFEMYPVSKILDNGGSVDNLTREAFQAMIDSGVAVKGADLNGNTSWTTGADGKVTTGLFIFDSYVLWEKIAEGYELADPIVIELPSVEIAGGSSDDENDDEAVHVYAHVLTEQPEAPFEQRVINFSGTAYLQIIKVDAETGEPINGAEFELYNEAGEQIVQNGHGNPWTLTNGAFTTDDPIPLGVYRIVETKAPSGYFFDAGETILTVSQGTISATNNGNNVEVTRELNAQNKVLITVKIPNKPIKAYITKFEHVDGEKVHQNVTLELRRGNELIDSWNTADDIVVDGFPMPVHEVTRIPAGVYQLIETQVPAGYTEPQPMTVTIGNNDINYYEFENLPIEVVLEKEDFESHLGLPGATLQLLKADGSVAEDAKGNKLEWVTDGQPKTFKYVPSGTYTLHEVEAPVGYQLAADQEIVVRPISTTQTYDHMRDARTFGKLIINKFDAQTNEPLEGVKFEVRSKNDVVDPITNETIYEKDQLIETIVTNADGVATMTTQVPIATYDANGMKDYIEFYVVETEAAPGQYAITTISDVIRFTYVNGSTPLIIKTLNLTNEKPVVTVTKTGIPETFVGNYDEKHDITVLKTGDIITYTISVTNSGMSTAYDVTIKDALPENTEFVSAKNLTDNTEYTLSNGVLYATLDEVPAGDTINIEMKVRITVEGAAEIVNIAYWTMPNTIDDDYTFDENGTYDWTPTDSVVHQVVEFHKTSEVLGGTTASNATAVAYGDTITYKMTFNNVDDVKNVVVTDVVPEGLTYVSGSAMIDGVTSAETTYNPSTRMVTFAKIDAVPGTHTFEFKVTVDYVEVDTRKDFDNVAIVEFTDSTYEDSTDTIESEHVTHYAEAKLLVEKHGDPKTYEGPQAEAHDLTVLKKSAVITYTINVTNTGNSTVKNIVITDAVPAGTTYVTGSISGTSDVTVYEGTDKEAWTIAELAAGRTATLTFQVYVNEQKAAIIDNVAYYGIVEELDNVPTIPDNMKETNHVIHQVVEFHKTSEIPGGDTEENAAVVATDDTIVYTLSYISKAPTSGVIVGDKVPEGLTLIPESIMYQLPNSEEWVKVPDEVGAVTDQDGNVWVVFPEISPEAGVTKLRFSVTVDRISVEQAIAYYKNNAVVVYDKETNNPDTEKDDLISNEITHMTEVSITGEKTSNIPTFMGEYSDKNNITVVSVGDKILFTITVKNTGVSDLHDVYIRDTVPEYTELVKEDNPDYTYDEETRTLTWVVDTIKSGESASVSFPVVVTADLNTATEIVNIAEYSVPVDKDDIDDDEWIETDSVVYQLVEFHKGCSIDHGVDEKDALHVEIGSKFSYILTFICVDDVYGLSVVDAIPKGLSYIDGSAKVTIGGETKPIDTLLDPETNLLTFATIDEVKAGTVKFVFDVKVEDVKQYDVTYYFINQAKATVKINKDDKEKVELISETISHKTIKTNTPDTPVLGFEGMDSSKSWSIIALISFVGMVVFGYFGFIDNRKKKRQ